MITIVYGSCYKTAKALSKFNNFKRLKFKRNKPLGKGGYTNRTRLDGKINLDTAFLLGYYPPARYIENPPEWWNRVRHFYTRNKPGQSDIIGEFMSVPDKKGFPAIVRPVRHKGGRGYHVVENEDEEKEAVKGIRGRSYRRRVVPKDKEFRIIFVFGKPILCLLKKVPEDADPREAWNHQEGGARFLTVKKNPDKNDWAGRFTSFYEDAKDFFERYPLHFAGIDVGIVRDEKEYAVFEINTAPLVDIEENLQKVKSAIEKELA